MRRAAAIGVLCIIVLPLVLLVFLNADRIKEAVQVFYWSHTRSTSPQYTAETKTPGYSVAVVNTAFLEYLASTMNIYGDEAIVDPRVYFGEPDNPERYTVSHLKFELVPMLDRYMVGIGGKNDFAGRGVYAVEGDTLIVRVSLNEEEVAKTDVEGQFALEDIFLDTALQTLSYVRGSTGSFMDIATVAKIQKDIKEYVRTGIFERPIRIDTASQ